MSEQIVSGKAKGTYASWTSLVVLIIKDHGSTYNGNLSAEVILDLASFDGIGGMVLNDLGKL